MTVDNRLENAATCLEHALRVARQHGNPDSSMAEATYVTAPQRLDQNTSGLIVYATTKSFANYFAGLLRNKTAHQLKDPEDDADQYKRSGVHKVYRCLVCIVGDDNNALSGNSGWSVQQAVKVLRDYQNEDRVMRHYLEPSERAPKRFAANAEAEDWAECLLKIKKVGDVCALVGNAPGQALAKALWDSPINIPPQCQAIVELEIELLTGRTHQIRGQLSTAGFPLVGDAQYGGFVPLTTDYQQSARLALQCCKLEFLDPDVMVKTDGTVALIRSQRWNTFELTTAWWTQLLKTYTEQSNKLSAEEATTLASDIGLVEPKLALRSGDKPPRPDLLPPRVSLSPGQNKYVLIRASHPDASQVEWFVKSASPQECGGPYHGNVAQDLREWIQAAGYNVQVTGGGRIDYRPNEASAKVYGFSYGFGKGDHVRAAKVIQEWFGEAITATYDNSDDLY